LPRSIFFKGVLISVVIILFTLVLVGCVPTIPPPTTGTVYIVVIGTYYYDLYMDQIGKFWGVLSGTYILSNVPIGNHFFEAIDIDAVWWEYDGHNQYITAGINYVYLYPAGIPIL
jgi:hypothetical protein